MSWTLSSSKSCERSVLTDPCVPTGAKTGVSMLPCGVLITPARARVPSHVATISKIFVAGFTPPPLFSAGTLGIAREIKEVVGSLDEHRVPIRIEPVSVLDGFIIGKAERKR